MCFRNKNQISADLAIRPIVRKNGISLCGCDPQAGQRLRHTIALSSDAIRFLGTTQAPYLHRESIGLSTPLNVHRKIVAPLVRVVKSSPEDRG